MLKILFPLMVIASVNFSRCPTKPAPSCLDKKGGKVLIQTDMTKANIVRIKPLRQNDTLSSFTLDFDTTGAARENIADIFYTGSVGENGLPSFSDTAYMRVQRCNHVPRHTNTTLTILEHPGRWAIILSDSSLKGIRSTGDSSRQHLWTVARRYE
jgi:hypothetical protein